MEAASFSGFFPLKIRIPFPIATGLTKKFISSIRPCSIREDTNVAPP